MRRTFLLAWPLDRRAGTSRQPLRERTGGRGAIRGSLPTRRDARIPQSPSQAPVTAPFRQGGHCGLLKRRPVCAGRRGRHPSSAGHPQDDMAGSGTIRGIAPYGRGKDGRPHPALRATCPPCGARKTVRAYADPPVFRPLRKKSPRFFAKALFPVRGEGLRRAKPPIGLRPLPPEGEARAAGGGSLRRRGRAADVPVGMRRSGLMPDEGEGRNENSGW